jgi:hypothetical protein
MIPAPTIGLEEPPLSSVLVEELWAAVLVLEDSESDVEDVDVFLVDVARLVVVVPLREAEGVPIGVVT